MAQTSTPARARPCAPETRREWPLTRADRSGVAKGTCRRRAASTMVATILSFETAAPSTDGNSGRSKSGPSSDQRPGKRRRSRASCPFIAQKGHDARPPPSQLHPCALATPSGLYVRLRGGKEPTYKVLPPRAAIQRYKLSPRSSQLYFAGQEPGASDHGASGPHGTTKTPRLIAVQVEFAKSEEREGQSLHWTSAAPLARPDNIKMHSLHRRVERAVSSFAFYAVMHEVVFGRSVTSRLERCSDGDDGHLGRWERGKAPLIQCRQHGPPHRRLLVPRGGGVHVREQTRDRLRSFGLRAQRRKRPTRRRTSPRGVHAERRQSLTIKISSSAWGPRS